MKIFGRLLVLFGVTIIAISPLFCRGWNARRDFYHNMRRTRIIIRADKHIPAVISDSNVYEQVISAAIAEATLIIPSNANSRAEQSSGTKPPFDPDAFLAKKQHSSFDPDAFLRKHGVDPSTIPAVTAPAESAPVQDGGDSEISASSNPDREQRRREIMAQLLGRKDVPDPGTSRRTIYDAIRENDEQSAFLQLSEQQKKHVENAINESGVYRAAYTKKGISIRLIDALLFSIISVSIGIGMIWIPAIRKQ